MKRKPIWILCLVIIVVVLTGFLPLVPQLTVTNESSGRLLLALDADPGTEFSVSYIHSVNKSKVTDTFIITPNREIMVEKTRFVAYGAGIPEPEEGTDQTVTVTDDYVEIDGLHRLVGDYYGFFVGVTATHTLYFAGMEPIVLKDIVPVQSHIIVDVEKIGWIPAILH